MSTQIRLQILQKTKVPEKTHPEYSTIDVLQKVQEYLRDINSNLIDSYWQWQYIKRLYNVLSKKPDLNIQEKRILVTIEPEIMKHAEYDVENAAELDGVNMFRYSEDEV